MASSLPLSPRSSAAWAGLAAIAAVLFLTLLQSRAPLTGPAAIASELDDILVWYSEMPRAVTALLCGAALGLSGALLQRVLRNPIADPSTIGIASGAQLALTLATAFVPGLIEFSREGVAFAGGVIAVAIILGLSWRRGLDPVTVVISGMVVSMVAAALGATIILARGEYVMSLYIWGAGSLSQQSWDAALAIAPRLALGCAAAALLLRPLAVLGLDDTGAKSLGVALQTSRFLILGVAIWLAANVVAEVGIIGFVGLAAPAFARAGGARTPRQILTASPIIGAILLSVTDTSVQLLGSGLADIAPTGAATALFGGPILLWLLPRVRSTDARAASLPQVTLPRITRPWRAVGLLALAAVAAAALALVVGQGPIGWTAATGPLLTDLLPFRVPRLVAAGAAGAMLGAAGTLMQRLTANPVAGPEILGVSAGGGVGLAIALYLLPVMTPAYLVLGIAGGSLVTLLIVLAIASRSGFGAERLLLAGVAIGSLCMAVLSTVLAQGDVRSYTLLVWMSGSTNRVSEMEAWTGLLAAVLLVTPLFFFWRWLDILPLGEGTSRSLGLPLTTSRLILAIFAAVLTAVASFLIGPLSLIGLIAPHLARLLGFVRSQQLLASVLTGCAAMVVADWLSRVLIFPYQVPVGLFAALIGGPYLIWLLRRGEAHQG